MNRNLYRKTDKKKCIGCDYPSWCPSKKINADNKCTQCLKNGTKRSKINMVYKEIANDDE